MLARVKMPGCAGNALRTRGAITATRGDRPTAAKLLAQAADLFEADGMQLHAEPARMTRAFVPIG